MEAEYSALSEAMKDILPMRILYKELLSALQQDTTKKATFKTTVWEDNTGCLTLAKLEPGRQTPRSKFYALKMHWFRSKLKPNEIEIEKIETAEQQADILTKALRGEHFRQMRKLLCGW